MGIISNCNKKIKVSRLRTSSALAIVAALTITLSLTAQAPFASLPRVWAATTYELAPGDSLGGCVAIGGTWNSGTSTCTLNTSFTLNGGNTLKIDSTVTLSITGSGSISSLGIYPGPTASYIDNNGIIANSGLVKYNQLNNTATINNLGIIKTTTYFSNLYNYGVLSNAGKLLAAKGSVEYNFASGVMNNNGLMTDTSCVGACQSDSVTVYNDNIINNNAGGKILNAFHFVNNPGGYSGATINNNKGASITNHFIFYQQGIVHNAGTFTNDGDVTGYCGATFDNTGGYFGHLPDTPSGCA